MIATMLGAPPQQQLKPEADSSDRIIRADTPLAPRRTPAGPIADAYGRFLELPVPMVLATLWVLGMALLCAATTAAYSAAIALL